MPYRENNNAQNSVSAWQVLLLLVCILGLAVFYLNSRDDFLPILDHANLAFHEAGHILFGWLGPTAGLYGGTLGQFVFPISTTLVFIKKANWFAVSLGLTWLFQSMLYMARYMADARARRLPLVGGGDHDWTNIFSRWHMLSSDVSIANLFNTIAWSGMLLTLLWLVRKWLLREQAG